MTLVFDGRCLVLPEGHWHCVHGHVVDCPRAWECPRIDDDEVPTAGVDDELVSVVVSDARAWVYPSEFEAERGRRVLRLAGQASTVHRGLSPAQLSHLLVDLGEVVVADLRNGDGG